VSEPVRFRDPDSEATPELRAVLTYAGARSPDAAQIAALSEAVLARLPITQVDAAPQRSASPEAQRAVSNWTLRPVGIGAKLAPLIAAGALVATWLVLTPREREPAARDRARVTTQAAAATPEQTRSVDDTSPDAGTRLAPASQAPQTAAPRQRAVRRERAQRDAPAASASANASSPAPELALLHAARIARRGSPPTALQLLHEHERTYPNSAFREEREALLIKVLQQLDPAQATKRLADFDAHYPASSYREGLRKQD
jgi:hypothetical protein